MKNLSILKAVMQAKLASIDEMPSYTKKLFSKGSDEILKKFGEESTEVIIAAKNNDQQKLISEIVDMLYHFNALCIDKNIDFKQIDQEIELRLNNGKDSDKVKDL